MQLVVNLLDRTVSLRDMLMSSDEINVIGTKIIFFWFPFYFYLLKLVLVCCLFPTSPFIQQVFMEHELYVGTSKRY